MESFVKRKSSFHTNNFMKNVRTVFKDISLTACAKFQSARHFLQKLELLRMKKLKECFIQTYTVKAPFTFLEECFCTKGNTQFVQKVTFEPSVDLKKTHESWKYYKGCYF